MTYPVIECINEAIKAAKGTRSRFDTLHPKWDNSLLPYPTKEEEVDAFIKQRIRLHHDTWIIKPLENALEALTGRKEL